MTETLRLDHPFWRFSLRVYAQQAVREECLSLQERLGIDVNLLLFVAWLAVERKIALSEADAVAAGDAVRNWHTATVLPLRKVRRQVKVMKLFEREEVARFRKKIAAVELEAEQIEQALLFEWAEQRWPGADNAVEASVSDNIAAYLRLFGGFAATALARAAQS